MLVIKVCKKKSSLNPNVLDSDIPVSLALLSYAQGELL